MTEKSEHIIRREHFVSGFQTAVERVVETLEAQRAEHFSAGEIGHSDAISQALARIAEATK